MAVIDVTFAVAKRKPEKRIHNNSFQAFYLQLQKVRL